MQFEIKAYRHGEGVVALSLEAASFNEARTRTGERGLEIISIRQHWRLSAQRRRKDPPFDLLLFSQELRSLIDAGLSLIEALGALSRKEISSDKRGLIDALIRHLREGKPFSMALQEFPSIFPSLYIALVSASEQTGDLASALGRFIGYRSQMDAIRKRIVSAAIYPSLLVGVGGLVILFLMSYVVPRFSRIYEDFGQNLPFMSRLLMQWGSLVQTHGLQVLMGLVVFGAIAVPVFKRKVGWRALRRKLLSHRVLRNRVQTYALSRFYRTLGMLQQGGIPIVIALGLAKSLLGEELQLHLDRVVTDVRAGVALSEAMERQNLAPPVASDLLKVGEKTGDIGEKMIRIADFYDEDLSRWTEWFVRLFEPLLMLGIGLFIAFIVVLLYMPIFELSGSIQ